MQLACLKRANAQQATCEVFILGYGARRQTTEKGPSGFSSGKAV